MTSPKSGTSIYDLLGSRYAFDHGDLSPKRVTEGAYKGQHTAQCDGNMIPGVSFSSEEMSCMIDEWEISNRDLYLNLVTRNEGRICINFENVVQNELFRESVDQVAAKCLTTEREKKQARLKRAFELHTKPTFWEKSWQALLNGQGGFIIPTAIFSGLAALVAKRIYGQKTAKLPDILKDQARRLDDLERRARDIDDDDDPPAPTGGGGKVPAASEASETAAESSAAETAGFAALFVGALTILGTHGHKIVGGMRSLGTSLAVGIEGAAALPFMFYDPQLMPPEYRQGGDEA